MSWDVNAVIPSQTNYVEMSESQTVQEIISTTNARIVEIWDSFTQHFPFIQEFTSTYGSVIVEGEYLIRINNISIEISNLIRRSKIFENSYNMNVEKFRSTIYLPSIVRVNERFVSMRNTMGLCLKSIQDKDVYMRD